MLRREAHSESQISATLNKFQPINISVFSALEQATLRLKFEEPVL